MKCKHRWLYLGENDLGTDDSLCARCGIVEERLSPAGVGLWLVALSMPHQPRDPEETDFMWYWREEIIEGATRGE